MKTFKNLNEQCVTSDANPGNALGLGVTNHLTPISNIVMNVRNFFASQLGVVASVAEDGISLKLNSSAFVNKEEIRKVLTNPIQRNMCLKEYVVSQGLDLIKMINIGQYWVVYFSPSDIKTAAPGLEATTQDKPVKEQIEFGQEEFVIESLDDIIIKEDEDEEIESTSKKELKEILDMSDRVKAAKKLEGIVSKEIELPREYYFAAVKSPQGKESLGLRWKYTKRNGIKETIELKKSLMYFYNDGNIFMPDLDEKSMFNLPSEVNTLINNILDMFDAEKTNDKAIYKIKDFRKKDNKEDKKDDKKDKSSNAGGLL